MSIVEETLRSQRESWAQIAERVVSTPSHVFPHEGPKRILIFGLGSSHFAARLVSYALMRDKTRVRTPVVACSSMSIGSEVIPQKGDWALALTHRGGSKPTVAALDLCRNLGAFTVAITGEGAKVVECAHHTLTTVPIEKVEPHTASVTGAICAATTLLMGAKCIEEWDALRSIGNPDLDSLRHRAGNGPAILMGEHEGEWLAREAGLKLMEMARLPVRVFGSEEYFHGPRFSRKPDDAIWHVSTPRDDRYGEIDAAYRVSVMGASPLAWVPALVELQWLALAVALNLGVNPDDPLA